VLRGSADGDALGVALLAAPGSANGGGAIAAAAYRVPVDGIDDAGVVYVVPVTGP
jgi:hypothetical protein